MLHPTQKVREFKKTAGQVNDPDRGWKLVGEEYIELCESISPENELKEMADLIYVLFGYADDKGYDLELAFNRVHKNNMLRMYQDDGTIKRREDGKIIKNPNTPKVYLKDLINGK